VTDTAWIDAALTSARPQAVGALLRYFRNLAAARSGGVADHGRAQCCDR
jgi:predicted RNA polymerase sigma factor